MRLPHVTIEYRDEESAGVGKVSVPLIFGFGIHWAWIFSFVFSASVLLPSQSSTVGIAATCSSMLCMALTLMSYTFFFKKIRPLFSTRSQRRRVRFCGALLTSIGVIFACVGSLLQLENASMAIVIASGLFTGVGSAVLMMSYGVSFSICDTAAAAMQFALSCLVACALYAIILIFDGVLHPFGIIFCVLMPWLELLCLNAASDQLVDRTEFVNMMMPVNQRKFVFHLGPSAFAFGLLFGYLGIHAFREIERLAIQGSMFSFAAFSAGVITCLLVIGIMLTQRQQANYAFRTLNPIIALLIAVVSSVVSGGVSLYSHMLFLTTYLLIEACLWISLSDMSQKFRISPFHVFGVGRGFLAFGAVCVTLCMLLPTPFAGVLNSTDSILPFSLVLLVFASASYPRDAEIIRVLERGRNCLAFLNPLDPANEAFKTICEARRAADDASEDAADEQSEQFADGQNTQVGVEYAVVDAPQGDVATSDAADSDGAEESNEELSSGAARAIEAAAPKSGAKQLEAEQDAERIGRYKRRCLALADMCLLSRRETEVLFLLAKGYNTKMIQEQLFISAGTANTHMRHVYRKLDVHSQQDLIRMVDSIQVDDEDWN